MKKNNILVFSSLLMMLLIGCQSNVVSTTASNQGSEITTSAPTSQASGPTITSQNPTSTVPSGEITVSIPSTTSQTIYDLQVSNYTDFVYLNHQYIFDGVVKATLPDYSVVDVTSNIRISEVDTSVLGMATVTIEYGGITKEIDIEVISNDIVSLSVDTSSSKQIYNLNEPFSSDGLKVYKNYMDLSKEEVENYQIDVYNSDNLAVSSEILNETGLYTIKVTADSLSCAYNIIVLQETYQNNDELNFSELIDNYQLTNDKYYFSNVNVPLLTSSKAQVAINGSSTYLTNLDNQGNYINVDYMDETFDARLRLSNNNSLISISVTESTILYVIGQTNNSRLVVKSLAGQELPSIGNLNSEVGLVCYSLKAGSYSLTANDSYVDLYSIMTSYQEAHTPNISSIVLNTNNVKKEYNVGDSFDISNLIVQTNTGEVLSSNDYRYEIRLNSTLKQTLDEIGTYEVKVILNSSPSIYQLYQINVINSSPVVSSITLNTDNVKKEYRVNDYIDLENLIVTDNLGNVLSVDEYSYWIDNSSVAVFGNAGSSIITIYLRSDRSIKATFEVSVIESKIITVKFGYSGEGAGDFNFFEKDIDLDNLNPADYAIVPAGYAFAGFSKNIYDAKNGDFIKIYFEKIVDGQYVVAFVDLGYQYYNVVKVAANTNAQAPSEYPDSDHEYFGWDTSLITPVRGNVIVTPLYYEDGNDITPLITDISESGATIDLGLDSAIDYEFHITLSNANDYEKSIEANNTIITDLIANAAYQLSGYILYSKDGRFYKQSIVANVGFVTFDDQTLSSFTAAEVETESYANGISVSTESFKDHTPDGYSLDSLALYVGDEMVNEVKFDNQPIITFGDLDASIEYRVDAFYIAANANTKTKRRYNVTPGYRIHFVGFQVHCNTNSSTLYRVDMMYQGENLYKMYYSAGSTPSQAFRFMLPIKYEHLTIVGSLDFVDKINSNQEWELILLDLNDTTSSSFKVVFYDYTLNNKIAKIEDVSSGSSATPPTVPQSYVDSNGVTHTFTGWSGEYTNITRNTVIWPMYSKPPVIRNEYCDLELLAYASPTDIFVRAKAIKGILSNAYNSVYYIEGGEYTVKTEFSFYKAVSVSPNTQYKITLEYAYYQNNVLQNEVRTLLVTTPSNFSILPGETIENVDMTESTSMNLKVTSNVVAACAIGKRDGEYHSMLSNIKSSYNSTITLYGLANSTNYDIYYFVETGDNVYYASYYQVVKTLDAVAPVQNAIYGYSERPGFVIIEGLPMPLNKDNIEIEIFYIMPELGFGQSSMFFYPDFCINNIEFWYGQQVQNPETGQFETYDCLADHIRIRYKYNGYYYEYFYDIDDMANWFKDNTTFEFRLSTYIVIDMVTYKQIIYEEYN